MLSQCLVQLLSRAKTKCFSPCWYYSCLPLIKLLPSLCSSSRQQQAHSGVVCFACFLPSLRCPWGIQANIRFGSSFSFVSSSPRRNTHFLSRETNGHRHRSWHLVSGLHAHRVPLTSPASFCLDYLSLWNLASWSQYLPLRKPQQGY